jgi:hypothetical protein
VKLVDTVYVYGDLYVIIVDNKVNEMYLALNQGGNNSLTVTFLGVIEI